MPTQYQVQSGDTVSAIAARNGVKASDISGYKSGDPNKINAGETLTIGGGAPAASPTTSAPQAGSPSAPDGSSYDTFYKSAIASLQPSYQQVTDASMKAGAIRKNSFDTLASAVDSQVPLVRAQYAALAKQFDVNKTLETDTANRIGTSDIGAERAALANSGEALATGSFAAPIKKAEQNLQDNIAQIASKYNASSDKLNADMSKDLGQLNLEATQYRTQGNNVLADVIQQQADLKMNFDKEVQSLASASLKASNDDRKYELEQRRLDITEKHQAQMEQIAEARLALSESNSTNKGASQFKVKYDQHKDTSGNVIHDGITFMGPGGEKVTAASYLRGRTGADPSRSQIAAIIGASGKSDDQRVAQELQDPNVSLDELTKKYPYILGE